MGLLRGLPALCSQCAPPEAQTTPKSLKNDPFFFALRGGLLAPSGPPLADFGCHLEPPGDQNPSKPRPEEQKKRAEAQKRKHRFRIGFYSVFAKFKVSISCSFEGPCGALFGAFFGPVLGPKTVQNGISNYL